MEKFVVSILKANVLVSVFIILVLLTGTVVKKRYSSKWKYAMWLAAGIFLLFPIPFASKYAPVQIELRQEEMSGVRKLSQTDVANVQRTEEVLTDTKSVAQFDTASSQQQEVPPNSTHIFALDIQRISYYFVQIWMIGFVLMGVYRILAYFISKKHLRRWALPMEDEEILKRYYWICQTYGIRKAPKVMYSTKLKSPVLVGLQNVCLYIPKERYSAEELNLIFHHELTHYRKKDLWYKTFLVTVNTIYWFNPFLYLVRHEAQKDIEYLCDCAVVKNRSKEECVLYSKLLLKTACREGYLGCASASLNDGTTTLEERIVYIMKKSRSKSGILPAVLCVAVLIFSNILVGCSSGSDAKSEPKKVESEKKDITKDESETEQKAEALKERLAEVERDAEKLAQKDDDESKKMLEQLNKEKRELERKLAELEKKDSASVTKTVKSKMPVQNGDYEESEYYTFDELTSFNYLRIYNATETSFEFEVYEVKLRENDVVFEKPKEKLLYKRHKAVYTGDGTTAVYKGSDYTIQFKLIEDEGKPGTTIGVRMNGFGVIEDGLNFLNNDIPGHEFS